MLKDIFPEDEYEKIKAKEDADRKMLALEFVILALAIVVFLGLLATAVYVPMSQLLKVCLFVIAFVEFGVALIISLIIEQKAGYYECQKCGHKYVPKFSQILWGYNMGRTRYLKCPECKKRSWSRKVISKD